MSQRHLFHPNLHQVRDRITVSAASATSQPELNAMTKFSNSLSDRVERPQDQGPQARKSKPIRRLFIWGVAILVFTGVAIWLMPSQPDEGRAATGGMEAGSGRQRVSIVTAVPYAFNASQDVSGLLAARNDIAVGTAISGQRIIEVLVDVGDSVVAGQLLARLENRSLAAQVRQAEAAVSGARATLAGAEAADTEARISFRRAESLSGASVISREQLGQRGAMAATAKAQVESARAELAGTQAQLTQIRLEQERTQIRAPKAGVITQRYARIGAMPDAAEPLFHLLQDGELELLAEVPESLIPSLRRGQSVTITVNGVNRIVGGHVRVVEPTVNPQSRLGIIRITVPFHADLRAGAFARGKIDLGARRFAVSVPEIALRHRREAVAEVVLVDGSSKVASRTVRLGRVQDGMIEITEGLQTNERIVESASAFLRDGDPVDGVEAATDKEGGR